MKRNNYANFAAQGPMSAGTARNAARKKLGNMASGKGAAGAYAKAGKAIGMIKANPGKAGLALAGLAVAGGLGRAGYKAMKKPKSLQDRIKGAVNKNPALRKASKMFR